MSFFLTDPSQAVVLRLARDRTRTLKQGYPWIYRDWLKELPPAPAGSFARVRDLDGSLIAFGMYDPAGPLAVRVCALEREQLDDELILAKLDAALVLRRALFDERTTGFRLLNGEGDGLPGLVCDVYGNHAVVKLDGDAPAGFWNVDAVADWLGDRLKIEHVFLKHRADADTRGRVLRGETTLDAVEFRENGLRFQANLIDGQKTGFFLDQRENRARIGTLAKGRSVLNCFAYTGGFSIYSGAGGAADVTSVDLAKPAIEDARRNWALNALPDAGHTAVAADVFAFLETARAARREWDLVIVDPPSFASAQRHVEKAIASYQSLFVAAMKVCAPGGILALSSCSSHITSERFLELIETSVSKARRRATVLSIAGQPADHPFPLACREMQYLKFVLLQVR